MSKNNTSKVFNASERKTFIKHIAFYLFFVVLLIFNVFDICLKTQPAIKDELTEITGKVFDVKKTRFFQHSIIQLNFIVGQDEYTLFCYNNISHDDKLIESIKREERITLLIKQRNSFLKKASQEVVDVRSDLVTYYDINNINTQRIAYCKFSMVIYFIFIFFFSLIFFLYHISYFQRINKKIRKHIKRKKKTGYGRKTGYG